MDFPSSPKQLFHRKKKDLEVTSARQAARQGNGFNQLAKQAHPTVRSMRKFSKVEVRGRRAVPRPSWQRESAQTMSLGKLSKTKNPEFVEVVDLELPF